MARFSMPSAITDRPSCLLSPMVELTIAASSGLVSKPEHEGAVDLEPVEREFLQIAEARKAGAEIVEHDADAERLDLQERVERALLVVQQDVLGDFELEAGRAEAGAAPAPARPSRRGRPTGTATATG